MKNLLSVLFFAMAFLPAFTCNAQTTKSNSVSMEVDEYILTDVKKMSEDIGIHIDSIDCSGCTSDVNAFTLSQAANIDKEKVKFVPSITKRSTITIYFREEVMIGDYQPTATKMSLPGAPQIGQKFIYNAYPNSILSVRETDEVRIIFSTLDKNEKEGVLLMSIEYFLKYINNKIVLLNK